MFVEICKWLAGDTGLLFTLFICLALGYAIGQVKIGGLSLGATVGTLLVGVVIAIVVGDNAEFVPAPALRSVFFDLFIFALGYSVGPAFVKSLKTSGLRLIILAVAFAVFSVLTGVACYFVFKLGAGELAGLFAGSMTQSSILGAAQTMMTSLGITGAAAEQMNADMTAAFALGYLISYAGCVILIKSILPNVVGCKGVPGLKDAVQAAVAETGYKGDESSSSEFGPVRLRTFEIGSEKLMTVGDFQKKYNERLQVETLFRPGATGAPEAVEFDNSTMLESKDVVALIGDLDKMHEVETLGLKEVTDSRYQKIMIIKEKMVITKDFDTNAIQDMFSEHVMPVEAKRDGKPIEDMTQFKHGDVVTIMGLKNSVQKVIKEFGYVVNTKEDSDMIFMSLGMIIGTLFGIITIHIAGIPFSFGASGGIMFLGIFGGWYNDKYPRIGHISPGALWMMKNIGLNLFVGCLGLSSGASFLSSLQSMGITVVIAILIMSFVPHIVTVLFGKYVLRLNPVEVLGGTCGSGTNTAALNGLIEETGSSIFATAYTPAYAMANIALTFIGTISVALFH